MNLEAKNFKSRLSVCAQRRESFRALVLAVLLPVMFLATLPVQATVYYVDVTNGNNSWSGTASNYVGGTTGPWSDFTHVNYGGIPQLVAGDVLYVMAGVINENPSANFSGGGELPSSIANIANTYGTSNNPITISAYPGASVIFSNCGPGNGFSFKNCCWLTVSGFQFTNCYRPPSFQYCTNCEFCSNYSGATITGNGSWMETFGMYNWCSSNYIHNNTFAPSLGRNNGCNDGGTHGASFGMFYAQAGSGSTNWDTGTFGNIIESNTFGLAGHDCLSVYGPSNVIQNNWLYSPPWINTATFECYPWTNGGNGYVVTNPIYWSSRVLDVGGGVGAGNLVQSNTITYGGCDPDGPGAITMDNGGFEIVRFNTVVGACGNSIQVYGKRTGGVAGLNYIYNNSSMFSGFGQSFYVSNNIIANYVVSSWPIWQTSMAFASTSNNYVVNNLDYWSFTNTINCFDGYSKDISRWANNFTNNVNPLFANTNNTLNVFTTCPSESPPDFHLTAGSPAIGAGTWLAYIQSASGSGTSFTVDNAGYFFSGLTACARTIPGDTIQLQGQTNTTQIISISGNTITVNTPLTWTNGQGLALPYAASAPDVGAYGYFPFPPPSNLRIVTNSP
jgi:hypothetical protein